MGSNQIVSSVTGRIAVPPSCLAQPRAVSNPTWLWAQLFGGFLLLEGALWSVLPAQRMWILMVVLWIAACVVYERYSAAELGLKLCALRNAAGVVALGIGSALVILISSWTFDGIHRPFGAGGNPLLRAAAYCLWALVQQFILNSFFFLRFEQLWGPRRAVWATTALFAVAHLPNPILTPATLVGAYFFTQGFRRFRSLYPLAIAHALLGLTCAVAFPDSWLHHMRVGMGYFLFRG